MSELCLGVRDYRDPACWRWVLTGTGGEVLADHQVRLDTGCWEYEAFADLAGYLRLHASPDRRTDDEARIVARVGEWIGGQVFGTVAPAVVAARPVTVRVIVPQEAAALAFRPLELAHVDGRPVALQDVTLVMQPGSNGDSRPATVGDRLRVLGLFSLPVGEKALNLRRERRALVRLFSELANVGLAVGVQVLQYGVTRARLEEMLSEPEGWDVVHISGHGVPGELLLEKEDGSPDPVDGAELAGLLGRARGRLKLVTLSACWSAAAAQRRLLGLPGGDQSGGPEKAGQRAGVLAADLARLGCAVLAMRYPVTDEFAIALAGGLYSRLAGQGQARLPGALAATLREVVAVPPTAACPALSVACPALFGAQAAGLRLAVPESSGPQSESPRMAKLRGFPPQPERLVGRTRVMAKASAALAPRSCFRGVLLHGMPGGGKTACARELAFTHEHAFDTLVWFKVPDEGRETLDTLGDFALSLENGLSGFQIRHLLDDAQELTASLAELSRRCEQQRLMIVIDNAEPLLSADGQWLDARWGQVIGALCSHSGPGRLVLTSRRLPAHLDPRVLTVPVDALSLDEALLLARELPHLARLIDGKVPGLASTLARKLARDVLRIAHGHPQLLELADGQAADPGRLQTLVQAGEQAWKQAGGLPEGFFTTGEPDAADEDYLHVLAAWTRSVTDSLQPAERDLFWFLCCLEEPDRIAHVAQATWPHAHTRLNRAGSPPHSAEAIDILSACGLITDPSSPRQPHEIHPAIAAAGRAQADGSFQHATDTELAAYWGMVAFQAGDEEERSLAGGAMIRAGISAAPYLLRLGHWKEAASFLEAALYRDLSGRSAIALWPILTKVAEAAAGRPEEPAVTEVVARALERIDPAKAEKQHRAILATLVASQDYGRACAAADGLARNLLRAGRLDEALRIAGDSVEYSRRAELGIWTELSCEAVCLQVRALMGQSRQVLDEVRRLRKHVATLPSKDPPKGQGARPWDVRERILDTGRNAAIQLAQWQEALDLSAATIASMRDRGAPEAEITRVRFGIYAPLVRLGRLDEALALLTDCRLVAERTYDIALLGQVFGALARVEHERGHGEAATSLTGDGLRYSYMAGDAEDIMTGHHNLGSFLLVGGQPEAALTHHLAAALIRAVTGRGRVEDSLGQVATDLCLLGDTASVPADVQELSRRAAKVPGVNLSGLLTRLNPDHNSIQQIFVGLADSARNAARDRISTLASFLAAWDPAIAALLAIQEGDTRASGELDRHLARNKLAEDPESLTAALRRMRAGERDPYVLAGLGFIDAAIARRALDALGGKVSVPTELWPAMSLAPLLFFIVDAAGESTAADAADQAIDWIVRDNRRFVPLGNALRRILAGGRDPDLADLVSDPTGRAIVATVLHHIAGS